MAEGALAGAADTLALLIRLADREADVALLDGLRDMQAGEMFAELLPVGLGRESGLALQAALDDLPQAPDAAFMDDLASDYADCFLTHGHRISPNGSVWMTEDKLERQEPMFQVREWYAHYGLAAPDWRKRADDHLVHVLQFVQALLALGDLRAAGDAALFMDRHVLPWVPEFGRRMAARARTPLMAAYGAVLADYLPALRGMLAEVTGLAPDIAALPAEPQRQDADATVYLPGAAPSW